MGGSFRVALEGAAALASVALAEPHAFVVSRHRASLTGLRAPLRLVQLSDLHFGRVHREGSVRRWLEAALRASPDLIVVTGDFLEDAFGFGRIDRLLEELRRLRAPLGVWAVVGNHDLHAAGRARRPALERALESAGVRLLVNRGERVRPDLFLAGVDDLWLGRPDVEAALEEAGEGATVLLSHNPDLLPRVPEWVALTLCGHTHGGQVVVPLLGAVHTGSSYGQRFAAGFVRGPARGFVSRGLGTTTLPVRFLCRPEVVVLELEPG